MKQTLRIFVVALFTVAALNAVAQQRPYIGAVVDVDEGRGRLIIESDDGEAKRMTIETDSVATTYHNFGTVINDKPEIFTGSAGLANVRLGDRIEVRAAMQAGVLRAERITLLGRDVAAPQVGVGQSRMPTSVATPTDEREAAAVNVARVEGTIRQINDEEGRIVIQTPDRRMLTIRTYRNTPVHYRGETYRVTNLEIGDRIRVETDPRDVGAEEISARRIDVTMSVQETGTVPGTRATVTTLDGRVTRVEPGLDYAYVNDGRSEKRVDMQQAEDERGDVIRARDLKIGDVVSISGSYNRVGDMFLASTVRFTSGTSAERRLDEEFVRYGVVTLTGTVVETLEEGATLAFRDRDTERVLRIWITPDFVVRTRGNTYTTAELLRVNDTAVIAAYRDLDGNLIAQTVRLRNR
jgi:hypothetical protein